MCSYPPAAMANAGVNVRGACLMWIVVLTFLDQLTKVLVFRMVPGMGDSFTVASWGETVQLHFTHVENSGGIFGLFPGWTAPLAVARGGAVIGLVTWIWRHPERGACPHAPLALVAAGALGNLLDNLFAPRHAVRDFVDFQFGATFHYAAFNLADACICVGAVLLFLSGFRKEAAD